MDINQSVHLTTADTEGLCARITDDGRAVIASNMHELQVFFGSYREPTDVDLVVARLRQLADNIEDAHIVHLFEAEQTRQAEVTREAIDEAVGF